MQAALMIRSKKRVARRKRLRKEGRLIDLPSNVSVKQLGPFPRFPPDTWVGDLDTSVKVYTTNNFQPSPPTHPQTPSQSNKHNDQHTHTYIQVHRNIFVEHQVPSHNPCYILYTIYDLYIQV